MSLFTLHMFSLHNHTDNLLDVPIGFVSDQVKSFVIHLAYTRMIFEFTECLQYIFIQNVNILVKIQMMQINACFLVVFL